jgi:hypothetical protein
MDFWDFHYGTNMDRCPSSMKKERVISNAFGKKKARTPIFIHQLTTKILMVTKVACHRLVKEKICKEDCFLIKGSWGFIFELVT